MELAICSRIWRAPLSWCSEALEKCGSRRICEQSDQRENTVAPIGVSSTGASSRSLWNDGYGSSWTAGSKGLNSSSGLSVTTDGLSDGLPERTAAGELIDECRVIPEE